ncbi:MAG: SDR family oxidoreductase [Gammaproteobacteria bacterium]
MNKIMVIGAGSTIAQHTARLFAADGANLCLVGRDGEAMQELADDLNVRGAGDVYTRAMDVVEYSAHDALIEEVADELGGIDAVLIAHGTLPDQAACAASFEDAREALEVNFMSVVSLLTSIANYMEQQESGNIAVISSVAGDRGRQSNYVYGSAKGAVTIFLQGLRNRLKASGVHVLTIKPGFVLTPMTAHLDGSGPLWAEPEAVAKGIYEAMHKRRDEVYLPRFWELIMLIIRLIPERFFKRLKL